MARTRKERRNILNTLSSTDPLFGIHKRPEKIHSLLFFVDDRLRRVVQDDAFVVTVSPSFLYILLRPLQKKLLEFQKVVL